MMELWIGAVNLGFFYAFMAIGVFITFRILDFPDITVDGSFTAGAAVAAILIIAGVNPFISLIAAFLIGSAAGAVTGLIHTKLNVNSLLSGILVMISLYSINLHIMERSNIPLMNYNTVIKIFENYNPGINSEVWLAVVMFFIVALIWLGISVFFKTDFGITLRTTGDNPIMTSANGINVNKMKVFGVAFANGLVGLSGGFVAQYQGFADIGMGIGSVVIGLASVIIGESILKKNSITVKILSAIIGAVLFRFMIAFALFAGMNPIDLKLLTAVFVLLTLILSKSVVSKKLKGKKLFSYIYSLRLNRKLIGYSIIILIVVVSGIILLPTLKEDSKIDDKVYKIGIVQIVDNGMLDLTRDSFLEEMKNIGYIDGKNCVFDAANANGDLATLNSIIDKFLMDDMDLILSISTPATQAAINKSAEKPVVFATVANPFIIGAGTTEKEHRPNVTGVYGWVPMNETLEIVKSIFPGVRKIGAVWDPAHSNTVFNVEQLKKAIAASPGIELIGQTISNSSELYEAAVSVANKGAELFILPPDNTVYSAFDAVAKVSERYKKPIILSDHERLADGAFASFGYDYRTSGKQAAHIVDRIFNGAVIADIPFERYNDLFLRLNLKTAKTLGLNIDQEWLNKTDKYIDESGEYVQLGSSGDKQLPEKKIALFLFNDQQTILTVAQGVKDQFKKSASELNCKLIIEEKNAQNEYFLAQSVAEDILRNDYACVITLSTPALQVMANVNKKIPHVFGFVTDPYKMGIAENVNKHIKNITGVVTLQPVKSTIKIMREIFPEAKTIGIIWNPGEACSETCTYAARDAVKEYGFKLVERNVSNTGEVMEALNSIISENVDLFLTSGDNSVMMALEMIAKRLQEKNIPYFTNSFCDVDRGAFMSVGADYYSVGLGTARKAIPVINGADPAEIPLTEFVPEKMCINMKLVEKYKVKIPEKILAEVSK